MAPKSIHELIELVYKIPTEHDAWSQISERIAGILQGSSALFLHDLASSDFRLLAIRDMDGAAIRSYREHFAVTNPIVPRVLQRPDGIANSIESLISRRDFDREEYYNDWFRPNNFYHSTGISIRIDERRSLFFTFFRPRQDGAFSASGERILEALGPHLRQSVLIRSRFEMLNASVAAGYDALEKLGTAAFMLNRHGVVVELNKEAEKLVETGRALRILFGRLKFVSETRVSLPYLVQQAIDTRQVQTLSLSSGLGAESLEVTVLPPVTGSLWAVDPTTVMLVKTPRLMLDAALNQIADAYGLTKAERRLVASLASGDTLNSFCEKTGLSRNTVKTQLSSLFSKTGTSQQKELVRLVFTRLPSPHV